MRRLSFLCLFALGACPCAGGHLVARGDAGVVDGGFELDAGTTTTDAGMPNDSGRVDAGLACVIDAGVVNAPCEGDEDFCRSYDGSAPPGSFVAAAWSRIENGNFVLDLRFASPPFLTGRDETVVIGLEEDANPADGNHAVDLVVDGGLAQVVVDHSVALSNGIPNGDVFPPSDYSSLTDVAKSVQALDPCTIQVAQNSLYYRFTISRDPPYQTAPSYFLLSDDPTGATAAAAHSESPGVPSFVSSMGGRADALQFVSLCSARCPTRGED